jgi:hypothetical protein
MLSWTLLLVCIPLFMWVTVFAFHFRFNPTPRKSFHSAPSTPEEARRQDLDDLRQLLKLDRSFTRETQAVFQKDWEKLRFRTAPLSEAQFEMDVARLVALAGNGHTTVDTRQRGQRFASTEVRLMWFAEGLFVTAAAIPYTDLLGSRVETIDGRTIEEAFQATLPFLSGTSEHARADSTALLVSPPLLKVIWPDTNGSALRLGLRLPDGTTIERSLPSTRTETANEVEKAAHWRFVQGAQVDVPPALQEPDRSVLFMPLPGIGVYVRINALVDDQYGPLESQLDSILSLAPASGWDRIVVDLRFNNGGDYLKTLRFSKQVPTRLSRCGTLWLLTSNRTFSAAIVTLARLKYFARDRAHIVGELIGDHSPFWAEQGAPLVLSNSGIRINYATGMHDWQHGCSSLRDCFWLNLIYGVAAGDLAPTIPMSWRFSDYVQHKDTVMDYVLPRRGAKCLVRDK